MSRRLAPTAVGVAALVLVAVLAGCGSSGGQHGNTIGQVTSGRAQTRLVVEERGIPLEELAAHGAGWQAHLEDLAAHGAGREPTDWRTRWTELTPSYREQTVRPA